MNILTNKLKELLFSNNSIKQTIVKNTFWLMLAEGFSKIILFVNTILITRYLGVTQYGQLSFAFAYLSLFSVFIDFGFNMLIIREVARNRKVMQTYVNNIMSLKLVMSIIVALLVAGSLLFVSKDPVIIVLVLLITFYSVLQSFILFFYSFFQGIENMQYNFIGKLFNALSLILLVAIVIYKNAGLYGVALAYVGSIIVTFILIILIVKKHTQNLYLAFDIPLWKKIMHDSWPFLAGIVSIMVYVNSDTVLLSFFRNYTEVGIYQAAYKIFFAFQSINLIHQVIYPKLAKLRQEKEDKKFNKLVRHIILYSVIVLVPFGMLVTLLSKQIIILIYGNSFQAASFPLIFLIWTGILIHFSTFWSNNLIIDNRQKLWFKAALGGAIINFLLNLIFIPFYGYKAASIITLVSEFVVFIIIYFMNNKQTRNFFTT